MLTDFISNMFERRKLIEIFLDLAKAFDTVEHNRLLRKIKNMDLKNSTLNLIIAYLSDRKQQVKVRKVVTMITLNMLQETFLGQTLGFSAVLRSSRFHSE